MATHDLPDNPLRGDFLKDTSAVGRGARVQQRQRYIFIIYQTQIQENLTGCIITTSGGMNLVLFTI